MDVIGDGDEQTLQAILGPKQKKRSALSVLYPNGGKVPTMMADDAEDTIGRSLRL